MNQALEMVLEMARGLVSGSPIAVLMPEADVGADIGVAAASLLLPELTEPIGCYLGCSFHFELGPLSPAGFHHHYLRSQLYTDKYNNRH